MDIVLKVYNDKDIDKYLLSKVKQEDIEDIKQNAIIQFLKIKDLNRINNPKNYFFIIIKNEIKKYYKNKEKHNFIELKEELEDKDRIENYMNVEWIKENYFILYEFYYLGLTIEDLKEKYNVEKSTIYNKIKEAKESLRGECYE